MNCDDQPKIATGGNCERTSMASLTNPAATPEECECYASGVVLGVMTSASPLVVASLLVALRDAWADLRAYGLDCRAAMGAR